MGRSVEAPVRAAPPSARPGPRAALAEQCAAPSVALWPLALANKRVATGCANLGRPGVCHAARSFFSCSGGRACTLRAVLSYPLASPNPTFPQTYFFRTAVASNLGTRQFGERSCPYVYNPSLPTFHTLHTNTHTPHLKHIYLPLHHTTPTDARTSSTSIHAYPPSTSSTPIGYFAAQIYYRCRTPPPPPEARPGSRPPA